MNGFKAQAAGAPEPIESQLDADARAWVRLLASGRVRAEDARKLEQWCKLSEAHAAAFAAAHRLWQQLGPVAELAASGDTELAAIRREAASRKLSGKLSNKPSGFIWPFSPRSKKSETPRLSRRAFLGSAVAASAAAGVALVYPPMSLWPALATWDADYRTGVGEQRQLALASDVSVQLNTRSSLAVQSQDGVALGVELIDGEIAVDTARTFTVKASGGEIKAIASRFEVRHIDASVCVTCLEGRVEVSLAGNTQSLKPNEQMFYGNAAPVVRNVDVQAQSDWQHGVLNFRQTALNQVISEINRYRPGRLVLMATALEQKPVSGRFRIDDLDKAIAQIQRLFHLDATRFPGGLVVLA